MATAVFDTYYAGRAVTEWELGMVAVVSPKPGEFGSSGQLVDGYTPGDVWASITLDRIAGVKPLNDWNEGLKEQRLKPSAGSYFDTATRFATLSWSTPWAALDAAYQDK